MSMGDRPRPVSTASKIMTPRRALNRAGSGRLASPRLGAVGSRRARDPRAGRLHEALAVSPCPVVLRRAAAFYRVVAAAGAHVAAAATPVFIQYIHTVHIPPVAGARATVPAGASRHNPPPLGAAPTVGSVGVGVGVRDVGIARSSPPSRRFPLSDSLLLCDLSWSADAASPCWVVTSTATPSPPPPCA